MTAEMALHAAALLLGVFVALIGLAFFIVGVAPGPSAHWSRQFGYSAIALTAAYYLLLYALRG